MAQQSSLSGLTAFFALNPSRANQREAGLDPRKQAARKQPRARPTSSTRARPTSGGEDDEEVPRVPDSKVRQSCRARQYSGHDA